MVDVFHALMAFQISLPMSLLASHFATRLFLQLCHPGCFLLAILCYSVLPNELPLEKKAFSPSSTSKWVQLHPSSLRRLSIKDSIVWCSRDTLSQAVVKYLNFEGKEQMTLQMSTCSLIGYRRPINWFTSCSTVLMWSTTWTLGFILSS